MEIASTVAVVVSVLILAWQTRELAEQSRLSTAVAGTAEERMAIEAVSRVVTLFVSNPELRPYFYDGAALPSTGPLRSQVLAVAELFADAVEGAFDSARAVHGFEIETDDWNHYAQELLSPDPPIGGAGGCESVLVPSVGVWLVGVGA